MITTTPTNKHKYIPFKVRLWYSYMYPFLIYIYFFILFQHCIRKYSWSKSSLRQTNVLFVLYDLIKSTDCTTICWQPLLSLVWLIYHVIYPWHSQSMVLVFLGTMS